MIHTIQLGGNHSDRANYCKAGNSSTFCLEALPRIYRLFMKGKSVIFQEKVDCAICSMKLNLKPFDVLVTSNVVVSVRGLQTERMILLAG